MRERDLEKYLIRRVKALGGLCFKFVSPGNAGVPDRLIILPQNGIHFLELKSVSEKPTPLQIYRLMVLRELGCHAEWVDTKEAIDDFLS
jgi:hypothetical protein